MCLDLTWSGVINYHRRWSRQEQLLSGGFFPSPVGASAMEWKQMAWGVHLHEGQRDGFAAFTVCFGGGDTHREDS